MRYMFVDDITIRVRAGNGGKGAVAFNKNLNQYGPAGGSGGDGGDVFIEGSSDFGILAGYRFKKEFAAQNGENGKPQFRDGVDAKQMVLYAPVGTVVHNLTKKTDEEVVHVGERIRVARGGHGGRGNFHFRSSTNRRPKEFESGTPGEAFTIRLEVKLIADVGFIGLPNVGKSSLLNELTRAKSKVANYAFTTLEPHLGTYYDLILADIPGLIEGASGGKGLGIKFLRHIERTNVLFHLISAESEDPAGEYAIVRNELQTYNKELLKKKEYVFLTKSDMVTPKECKAKLAKLKKKNSSAYALSIHDFDSIEHIKKILNSIAKKKSIKK